MCIVTRMILVDNKKDDGTNPQIAKNWRNFVRKKIGKKTASAVQV
jgi:hypothetical protein